MNFPEATDYLTPGFCAYLTFWLIMGGVATASYGYDVFKRKTVPLWVGEFVHPAPVSIPTFLLGSLLILMTFALWPGATLPLCIIVPILVYKKINIRYEELWGIKKILHGMVSGFVFLIPFVLPLYASSFLFMGLLSGFNVPVEPQETVKRLLETEDESLFFKVFFMAVIFAPLWEEIFFRGFLYPICKHHLGKTRAILFSAIFFAAFHFHLPSFLPLAFLGVVLVWVYEKSGSLMASITLHSCFNMISLAGIYLARPA